MRPLSAHLETLFFAITLVVAAASNVLAVSFTTGIQTGTIQNAAITEASGIAASRMNANVLWTHNDSGGGPQVYPMTPAGTNLGTYTISGAGSTDWEDIAVGPGPTAGLQYLYVADIGDNPNPTSTRPSVVIYRVPEPTVSQFQSPQTVSLSGMSKLTFTYPGGPRDAESMFVDPLTRDIYIISKRENPHHVYRAAYPQSSSVTTVLEEVASFNDTHWLTGADISVSANEIIVRGDGSGTVDDTGRMFIRPTGGSIADAFGTSPVTIPLVSDGQGEAIGFDPMGWGYYTTSEGSGRPIHYFNRVFAGDYDQNKVIDAADYVLGRNNAWSSAAYNTWRAGFGKTSPPNWSLVAVPEPQSFCNMVSGALIALTFVRRHR